MNTFIAIIEIAGIVVFAISGAMTGIKKNMDLFGVIILGLVTAVGGGIARDIIIGSLPPVICCDPMYAVIAVITSVIVFIIEMLLERKYIVIPEKLDKKQVYDFLMTSVDSIGLGVFSVIGVQTAYSVSPNYNLFTIICVGVLTGVGGGVARDILAGDIPYIFVKHVYACASLAGVLVCALLWNIYGEQYSMIAGAFVIIIIRFLSAHFRWEFPHIFPRNKNF